MNPFAAQTKEIISKSTARKVFSLIDRELELVESEFERQAASNIQVIDYLGGYLRQSGGKRVRPALLILSTYASGGDASQANVVRMATVMEMLHTATLVHDDIIDNADVRRSRRSVNATFGNQTAVLMGDWLYMSAFETSLAERSLEILDILTRLTRKMTEGELIQLTLLGKADISEDEYFDIVRRKTAYLFSGCCEIGGILGNANHKRQRALRDFGLNLGIAFQIADDLLDFTADSAKLGKATGADMLEGKVTLPLIKLMKFEPKMRPIIEDVMESGRCDDETRRIIDDALGYHDVIQKTQEIAAVFASSAIKNLEIFDKTSYREALAGIAGFVIEREN
ncbi:MAG: polyprenyl synthetase family protein [Blastocatellia bacterium]